MDFPLGGNVSLVAGISNITGQSTDIIQNSSLSLDATTDSTSGESSGSILTNDTSSLKFSDDLCSCSGGHVDWEQYVPG